MYIYIFNVYTSLYIHNTTREQCLSAPQQLHRRGQAALGAPPAVSSASVAAVHHGSRRDIPTMVAPARLLIHASPSLYQLLHPSACSLDIEERHSLLKTYIYIYIYIYVYIFKMQLRMTDEPADLLYMATASLIFHHFFRLLRVPTYVATAHSVNVNPE